jgi:hypothetical protein
MVPLLICERKGRWAADWRRLAVSRADHWPRARLMEVRLEDECLAALASAPAAMVLLECTAASLPGRLALMEKIDRLYPEALCVAAVDPGLEPWHDLLREFGAVHLVTSPLGLVQLAQMLTRREVPDAAHGDTLRSRIWNRLPWPQAAERVRGGSPAAT